MDGRHKAGHDGGWGWNKNSEASGNRLFPRKRTERDHLRKTGRNWHLASAMIVSATPTSDRPSRMSSHRESESLRLAPQEWLFLALVILGWGIFVVSLGKDMSWDFRNYHWDIPYAFLKGRMGFDIS